MSRRLSAHLSIAGLLAACASASGPTVTVTESQAHGTVRLKAGQVLVVRLASNPTTGYRWTLVDAPQPVLAPAGTPGYARDPASAGALGAGGTEEWRFSAIRTGAQTLSFEYRRPWEHDKPAERRISFSVVVR